MKSLVFALLLTASAALAQIGPTKSGGVGPTTWNVVQVYSIGQVVLENGTVYQSLINNNQANDPFGSPSAWSSIIGGSGGGAVSSLTTTGTSGNATLTSGVLNIPNYTAPVQSITTTGSSGAATLSAGVLNIPQYAGSAQVYPGAGIPNSTGSAYGTSYTTSGTGTVVALTTSPTFTTPSLGAATATSVNNINLTAAASPATLTIGSGKTVLLSNSFTLVGTDAATYTFPAASNTLAPTASPTFTGTPLSTTAAQGTNSTQIATTAFAKLVDNSSETVTSSATPTFSVNYGTSYMVLTSNVTAITLAAGIDGQQKTICLKQGTTAYTAVSPTTVHGFFTIGTTINDYNCQSYVYNLTNSLWLATGPGAINM